MKRLHILSLAAVLILSGTQVSAQLVSEASREFIKKEFGNSLSIVVAGQPKNVSAVLDEKFKLATSVKPKPNAGLTTVAAARYNDISGNTLDYHYRVEKANKSDENQARVTLFISSGGSNFLDSGKYPEEIANARDMLEGLESEVRIYEMELQLTAQGKVVEKNIKEHEALVRDSVKLEVELAETLKAIEANKTARANKLVQISEEKTRQEAYTAQLAEYKTQDIAAKEQRKLARTARMAPQQQAPQQPQPANPENNNQQPQ
ncbi:MAG: hypothetical protein SF053_21685 [Bacteroidia bacterium]|nr:hypothetical protein [Bacteroidia bacterium]